MFYLQILVLIFLFLAGTLLLLADLLPPHLFESYLLPYLPWLGMRYGKALLLLISGTFCIDPSLYNSEYVLNHYACVFSLASGALWAAYYFLRVEANPSDYRGFQHPNQ